MNKEISKSIVHKSSNIVKRLSHWIAVGTVFSAIPFVVAERRVNGQEEIIPPPNPSASRSLLLGDPASGTSLESDEWDLNQFGENPEIVPLVQGPLQEAFAERFSIENEAPVIIGKEPPARSMSYHRTSGHKGKTFSGSQAIGAGTFRTRILCGCLDFGDKYLPVKRGFLATGLRSKRDGSGSMAFGTETSSINFFICQRHRSRWTSDRAARRREIIIFGYQATGSIKVVIIDGSPDFGQ